MGDKSRTGNKILANLFWRYAERCGAQLVQFIVSIVLARLIAVSYTHLDVYKRQLERMKVLLMLLILSKRLSSISIEK